MARSLRLLAAAGLVAASVGLPLPAQELWENPVKRLLREGAPAVGATITVPSVETTAQLANMGFDFLWIEMEHSAITLETARKMILATRGLKAVPLIRVPVNELWTAKRALDVGAMGVIFPFTSSAELARRAVSACKYAPAGRRGSGPGLAAFRWPAPDEGYHRFADRNVLVVVIIEDVDGVENVEEIAAVPGIDVIYIGPSDLSYSLGHGGQHEHPVVVAAIERIVAAAKRNGVPLGRPGGSPEEIQRFVEQGFTFFQSPSDAGLLSRAARDYLSPLGKRGFDPGERPLY
jgi:2-keto-3-deoxy-L-rhamnonate aldolase RhmA